MAANGFGSELIIAVVVTITVVGRIRRNVGAAERSVHVLRAGKNGRAAGGIEKRGEAHGELARVSSKVRQAFANQARGAFGVVGHTVAAVAIVHSDGFLIVVGGLCVGRPTPAVAADHAAIVEVI